MPKVITLKKATLAGVFPWFEIDKMRSVIIDIHWTKICTNITYLASGALSAHALIKRVSTTSSNVAASIVVLEYVANNYTEALVNKHQVFSSASAHTRPIDQSITSSTPCSEENLGPVEQDQIDIGSSSDINMVMRSVPRLEEVKIRKKGKEEKNVPPAQTGEQIREADNKIRGSTQYGSSNWATGIPTEVYYSINAANRSLGSPGSEAVLQWQFVERMNSSCSEAPLFNPSSMEVTFYWIAPSNTSLANLQLTIAEKLGLQLFQVQFDYTREAYKTYCSVYRVTILEEDWRLSEILSMFDVEGKKFTADAKYECSNSAKKTTPSPVDTTSVTGSVTFFTVLIVILLNI
ncbi:hypothetical protein TELCIR_01748 [Teladorsagia circumcincta]|uniref:Uncharacterized protein n=1 Tax=Teladorsagia circumcincta TaxID=45464 RepID=A0A2G9V378_TELCI|nr:hypothetical protein TELCIR_01748 [Teladorsagia circumcincta]